mgnify:CR=1 FL=1
MSIQNEYETNEENKIYIIGGKGVGKTSFFHLIFENKFIDDLPPSKPGIIKSEYIKRKVKFTIKDLSDDKTFQKTNILKDELEDVILIFVMFALNDKSSFEYAKNLVQFIKNNILNNKDLNIILLGNKYDLKYSNKEDIKVLKKEISQYIYKIDHLYYYDISCKDGHNIKEVKKIIDEIDEGDNGNKDDLADEENLEVPTRKEGRSCLIN